MSAKNTSFTPSNSAVVRVDHQTAVLGGVKSLAAEVDARQGSGLLAAQATALPMGE